jgi:hypothetical protein
MTMTMTVMVMMMMMMMMVVVVVVMVMVMVMVVLMMMMMMFFQQKTKVPSIQWLTPYMVHFDILRPKLLLKELLQTSPSRHRRTPPAVAGMRNLGPSCCAREMEMNRQVPGRTTKANT